MEDERNDFGVNDRCSDASDLNSVGNKETAKRTPSCDSAALKGKCNTALSENSNDYSRHKGKPVSLRQPLYRRNPVDKEKLGESSIYFRSLKASSESNYAYPSLHSKGDSMRSSRSRRMGQSLRRSIYAAQDYSISGAYPSLKKEVAQVGGPELNSPESLLFALQNLHHLLVDMSSVSVANNKNLCKLADKFEVSGENDPSEKAAIDEEEYAVNLRKASQRALELCLAEDDEEFETTTAPRHENSSLDVEMEKLRVENENLRQQLAGATEKLRLVEAKARERKYGQFSWIRILHRITFGWFLRPIADNGVESNRQNTSN